VVPPRPVKILSKKHRKARFLAVDSFLRVSEVENMYSAGDCIHLEIEGKWALKWLRKRCTKVRPSLRTYGGT